MTHDHEPHPQTDVGGDTIEFAAIELDQPERICYEVSDGTAVRITDAFNVPVEIRLGQTTETSPLFLHPGDDFPELCEAAGAETATAQVLVQPDVMAENPAMGWMVITEWTRVGRSDTPQFRLGRDISRHEHITLGPNGSGWVEIVGVSKNPTTVIVDRRYSLLNYELRN